MRKETGRLSCCQDRSYYLELRKHCRNLVWARIKHNTERPGYTEKKKKRTRYLPDEAGVRSIISRKDLISKFFVLDAEDLLKLLRIDLACITSANQDPTY
jgi:hypothetical protein